MNEFVECAVEDAMTYRPVTVGRRAALREVEALFEKHDHDCFPVQDTEGALVGVVTKLDFLRAFTLTGQTMVLRYEEIMALPVESIMTVNPITVTPDTTLTRVIALMVGTRHKSFPVVRGTELLGIVSRHDVLQTLRRAAKERAHGVTYLDH